MFTTIVTVGAFVCIYNKPINQFISQSINQLINQPTTEPTNQSIGDQLAVSQSIRLEGTKKGREGERKKVTKERRKRERNKGRKEKRKKGRKEGTQKGNKKGRKQYVSVLLLFTSPLHDLPPLLSDMPTGQVHLNPPGVL